jgi:DNA-binding NarL/FixJ family response regulator
MSQQDHRAGDSHFPTWMETIAPLENNLEIVQLSVARARAMEEAEAAIARQLNGPLTALLLYMNEIKQHSHQFSEAPGNRVYLQQVVDNAVQQLERGQAGRAKEGGRTSAVMFASESGQKPLTKREREVLSLISEGCSNKQGALRMNISPRTFESHRAEAMRKLGARNTADLVRKALLQPA